MHTVSKMLMSGLVINKLNVQYAIVKRILMAKIEYFSQLSGQTLQVTLYAVTHLSQKGGEKCNQLWGWHFNAHGFAIMIHKSKLSRVLRWLPPAASPLYN